MNLLQRFIASRGPGWFLRETDMPELVALSRLCPVLVRCGGCRFTCAAQDCEHLIACITAGGDYVRDVCFPSGSLQIAAGWKQETPAAAIVPPAPRVARATRNPGPPFRPFHPEDCGGAFDGFTVTSDADPGL